MDIQAAVYARAFGFFGGLGRKGSSSDWGSPKVISIDWSVEDAIWRFYTAYTSETPQKA